MRKMDGSRKEESKSDDEGDEVRSKLNLESKPLGKPK